MRITLWVPLGVQALVLATASHSAAGQQVSRFSSAMDLGAQLQRDGTAPWEGFSRLAPALRFDVPWMQLGAGASLDGSQRGLLFNHGVIDAAVAPAPIGRFRFSGEARAERLAVQTGQLQTPFDVQMALSYALGDGGIWVGAAVERAAQLDAKPSQPLPRFGVWRRFGGALVSLSSSSHALRTLGRASSMRPVTFMDSVYNDTTHAYNFYSRQVFVGDSGTVSRTQLWSDLELGASWSGGALALDATMGARRATDAIPREVWAHVSAAFQLTPRLAVVASGGNNPSRLVSGTSQSRVALLGLRISAIAPLRPPRAVPIRTSSAAFYMELVSANTYLVSVRVPRARTVELSGDFRHWQAVSLVETRPDVWETTLTLPPGAYRMNIRVDGDEWRAPPGLPTLSDEFNGTVGIVVVK
ncbi:MAG: hypothetical protein ABI625_19520 [bacterium]